MARIIGIDYGLKRVGLATTDPMQIIASALTTVTNEELMNFLKKYCEEEDVEAFALGMPKNLNGDDTDATEAVRKFALQLEKEFPQKPIHLIDERFTSKMALSAMIASGTKKKDRRVKGNIDKISATIILQSYMEQNNF